MKLSRREAEVLDLLVSGRELKEAAPALGIGLSSVSTYLHRAKSKLGARTSFEAIAIFTRERVKEEI